MAYVIFGDNFTFPEGDASTNRVYTYAKGLTESGINVHVVCFGSDYTPYGEGITEGIKYYHPFNQKTRNRHFIIRRWHKFIKYFKTFLLLKRIRKEEDIDCTVVYTMRLFTHLFGWFLARGNNSKLIRECSEHPLLFYRNGYFKKKEGLIKLALESFYCDGIFCISHFLIDFFRQRGVPDKKLFLIPSTVDPTRFLNNELAPLPYSYVGYFGGLTFDRDNIDTLVRAFAAIRNKHPEIHLVLGGFCSEKDKKLLTDLIDELKIESEAEVLKYLPRDEIIKYITHSYILVMVRARSLETQASFPSKLTEYLSTSKPVITVNVGEIPEYLTDGLNAFLVEPGDINGLSEKLDYVLNNYESALKVAGAGRELTNTVFNYNYQSKRIIEYIESLN